MEDKDELLYADVILDRIYDSEVKNTNDSIEHENDANDMDIIYTEKNIVSMAVQMKTILVDQSDMKNIDDPEEHENDTSDIEMIEQSDLKNRTDIEHVR